MSGSEIPYHPNAYHFLGPSVVSGFKNKDKKEEEFEYPPLSDLEDWRHQRKLQVSKTSIKIRITTYDTLEPSGKSDDPRELNGGVPWNAFMGNEWALLSHSI